MKVTDSRRPGYINRVPLRPIKSWLCKKNVQKHPHKFRRVEELGAMALL